MAWLPRRATKQGYVWQDSAEPRRLWLERILGTRLGYESVIDSGDYDTPVDATPQRVNNADFDGWRVEAMGWQYALGRDLANHGTEDGWVDFGGRRGQNWLKFRLQRVGYLNYTTKAFQAIGGAATYNRANLTSETHDVTLGPDDAPVTLHAQSVATWANLWSGVSIQWRVEGHGLKEEITLSQATREALPNPQTGYNWFVWLFKLDVSDVPRWVKDAVLQGTDFDDSDGAIRLEDAAERFLALLPIDYAWSEADPTTRVRLRKRIWRDGAGDWWLIVGARVAELAALPAGGVVFDPTLTLDEGEAGADKDSELQEGAPTTNHGDHTDTNSGNYEPGDTRNPILQFDVSGIPAGSTIDSATLTLTGSGSADRPFEVALYRLLVSWTEMGCTWNSRNGADNWTSGGAQGSGTDRAASATDTLTWPASSTAANAFDVAADIQAFVDGDATNYGWVLDPTGAPNFGYYGLCSSDHAGAANRPRLVVEYTEAGGVEVAPAAASAVAGQATPTVVLGSLTQAPAAGAAVGAVVDPAVVLGNVAVTPGAGAAIGAVVDPATVLSALSLTPGAAAGIGAANGPTVVMGSLTLAPGVAAAIGATVNPTVQLGSLSIAPDAAAGIGATVAPAVIFGALGLTPGAAGAVGAGIIGATVQGSLTLSPAAGAALGATIDPQVTLGSPPITPAAAAAIGETVAPTVVLGSLSVGPGAGSALGAGSGPAIVLGSLSLTPAALAAIAAGVDPSVVVGSPPIAPTAASAIGATQAPSVVLGSLSITPGAAGGVAGRSGPTVVLGSLSVTPAAIVALAAGVDPTVVVVADLILSPDAAGAIAGRNGPTVVFGGRLLITLAGTVPGTIELSGEIPATITLLGQID